MKPPDDWFRWLGEDLQLRLRVQPGASRDQWAEPWENAMKVQIKAPPVDGKANACLIAFLARSFGVPKQRVTLKKGAASRTKVLFIERPTRLPPSLPTLGGSRQHD